MNKNKVKGGKNMEENKRNSKKGGIAILVIGVLVLILLLSIYTIPAGHVGVYHLFGKVNDVEKKPGMHLKNPFAQVTKMSIKTQEYTMSGTPNEGQKRGVNDAISSLTKEGLTVDLDVTVLYRLEPEKASDIYKEVGTNYVNVIVRPKIRESIRSITAKYNAKRIYSEDREELQLEIAESISKELGKRGIIVERVLLRNVKLPKKVTNAIEEKLEAEQDAQKMEFVLQREKKESERKRVEAKGIADSNEIIANSLDEQYLRWYWIQNLDKHNDTIYVPVGNDGMPLFKGVK